MADRPHSRKVKIVEGTAEVKKGERVDQTPGAAQAEKKEQGKEKENKG